MNKTFWEKLDQLNGELSPETIKRLEAFGRKLAEERHEYIMKCIKEAENEGTMEIINLPSGGGKTTELIKRSAESCSTIVCINKEEARRVVDRSKKMSLEIPEPITFNELLSRMFVGRDIHGLLIDNVDILLYQITRGIKIEAVTLTTHRCFKESNKEKDKKELNTNFPTYL